MWCIYKHTNKINGKVYIGQTCEVENPNKRWQDGRGYDVVYPFGKAIVKYGWDNFIHEIIETNIDTLKEANNREIYWIEYYHSYIKDPLCNGYNATRGGDNGDHLGIGVICIETGEFFESAVLAGKAYNIDPHGILGCCHHKPYMNTAGKMHWCFDFNYEDEKDLELKPYNGGQNKQIYCFELNKYFDTIQLAAKELQINHSDISNCCTKKRISAHGFHFCYAQDKETYMIKPNMQVAIVRCIETNEIFASATSAGESVNRAASNIIRACREGTVCANLHWEYVTKPPKNNRGGQNKKQVRCIETQELFESAAEASRLTNTCASSIRDCCKGKQQKTKNGYHWEYVIEGDEE